MCILFILRLIIYSGRRHPLTIECSCLLSLIHLSKSRRNKSDY